MVLVLSLAVPQLWSIWYCFIYCYKMIISAYIVRRHMYIYHINLWSATFKKITGLINVDQCRMYQRFQHIGIFVYLSCTHHYKMYIPSVFCMSQYAGGKTKPLFMVCTNFHCTLISNVFTLPVHTRSIPGKHTLYLDVALYRFLYMVVYYSVYLLLYFLWELRN